ncbi:hypothetical protein [Sporosarcina psychrophila]|uniref:hypothetical protein n=1 Tax=Sporosarcina psychrophila TaxID=1476 RepID=UPI00078B3A27|nr:hypothetical protein [Sporosarcina psychrophila]AMQ05911.1 hypothetical protein AZE41_08265 [Sporosarcina psychrophila]
MSKITWEIIVPEPHEPKYKKTVARVFDGTTTREHLFSRDMLEVAVEDQLLWLYMKKKHEGLGNYRQDEPRIIQRLDNIKHTAETRPRVVKNGIELVTIIDKDGCIISVSEDALLSGRHSRATIVNRKRKLMMKLIEGNLL